MAKIELDTRLKEIFHAQFVEDLVNVSLLKNEVGFTTKSLSTFLENDTAGHISHIELDLEEQTASVFFKTKNSVADGNPMLFSIASGETPKQISLWKEDNVGGIDVAIVGAYVALSLAGYSSAKDNSFTLDEIDINIKGDYEIE